MRWQKLLPLTVLAIVLAGCSGNVVTRPAQPVVADVTIHVPTMT